MKRVVEPELMEDSEQAKAYARADMAAAHQSYVRLFAKTFPRTSPRAAILDVGCGSADVTARFARAFPRCRFHAIDGSAAMLGEAKKTLRREPTVKTRVRFIRGLIPSASLPRPHYDVIICNGVLHHLHNPAALWQFIRRYSRPGTIVFARPIGPRHRR
jgi:ubiquinone/menaquinone biosynthesis C-methylase UbiE